MLKIIAIVTCTCRLSDIRAMLLFAMLVMVPKVALACQCLGDIAQNFKSSDHVLVAQISAAKAFPVHFEVEFEAQEILKGTAPLSPIYVTGAPSLLCGMGHVSVGLRYVFFIDEVTLKGVGQKSKASCHSFVLAGPRALNDLERLRNLSSPQLKQRRIRPECERHTVLIQTLGQLRNTYTNEHPDVVQVRSAIESLRETTEEANQGRSLEEICTGDR